MGSAVAHRLSAHGYTVLTSLVGRSVASRERARAAGMQDASVEEITRRAHYILSILPPSEAVSFAHEFTTAARAPRASPDPGPGIAEDRPPGTALIFADCNAVSPATAHGIAEHFSSALPESMCMFVDACIIGGPPSLPAATEPYDPTFYVSGAREAVERFAGAMRAGGLKVSTLQAGVGEASALKMGYAGIQKGLTGLTAAMILATHASSPATSTALMHELALSQPALLQRTTRAVPDMLPKAYRFVGEMREIRDFVDSGVEGGTAEIWEGLARLFQRIAVSVREGGEEVKVLEKFVGDAKTALQQRT